MTQQINIYSLKQKHSRYKTYVLMQWNIKRYSKKRT